MEKIFETKSFWAFFQAGVVVIVTQRKGEESTGQVTIWKEEFEELVKWYNENFPKEKI